MATNPRRPMSDRTNLSVVSRRRKIQRSTTRSLKGRLASTAVAVLALVMVVRYLPPGARSAEATAPSAKAMASPTDLKIGELQVSKAVDGEALYLDGLVNNIGHGVVTGATAQVDFYDAKRALIASEQKPLVGMARGGVDLVSNEFARNPMAPGEVRFFRVAVKQAPPQWNHEIPSLKIMSVTSPPPPPRSPSAWTPAVEVAEPLGRRSRIGL